MLASIPLPTLNLYGVAAGTVVASFVGAGLVWLSVWMQKREDDADDAK